MPPKDITPTSVVPPPTSITIEPWASDTGRPAPMAAAIGSSMRKTCDAPAPNADSRIARRSTWVEPQGTQIMMRGLGLNSLLSCTILINCFSICSVMVKSAITPSFMGRIASIFPGTRPNIAFASVPTARMVFLPLGPPSWRIATTDGSSSTIPRSRI